MTAPEQRIRDASVVEPAEHYGAELDTRRDIRSELAVLAAVLVGLAVSAAMVYGVLVVAGWGLRWWTSPIESPADDRPAYSAAPQAPAGESVNPSPVPMTWESTHRMPALSLMRRTHSARTMS